MPATIFDKLQTWHLRTEKVRVYDSMFSMAAREDVRAVCAGVCDSTSGPVISLAVF